RGKPAPYAYLTVTTDDTILISPVLREVVQFEVGNVLDPLLLASRRPFDIILCRNLLIYMTANAQKKVFDNVERLMNERGVFAVTATEAPLLGSTNFVRLSPNTTA